MMSSSAYALQDIEVVLIKLWQNRNVMLMNKSSADPPLAWPSLRPRLFRHGLSFAKLEEKARRLFGAEQ